MLPQVDLFSQPNTIPLRDGGKTWSLLFSLLLSFCRKGGKLGKLFCTANLVDRLFLRIAAAVELLPPYPFYAATTAITHAFPAGELAVPVCIVLLRRRYLIGTLAPYYLWIPWLR